MDQKSYLAQALWHYRSTDKFTDIEIVCKDGTLSAHVALLAPFFASLGLKFSSSDDVPDFLLLPDLAKRDVEDDLKKIYSGHKAIILLELLRSVKDIVKLEISDYVDEVESKPLENEKKAIHEDCDNYFGDQDDLGQSDEEAKDPVEKIKDDLPESDGIKPEKTAKRTFSSSKRSKMVECKECGDECHGMVAYLAHMKEFHAKTKIDIEGGNVCPYCEKVLKNDWLLKSHLALVHREELLKHHPDIVLRKPCPDCDEMFLSVRDLDKHTTAVHPKSTYKRLNKEKVPKFVCPHCKGVIGKMTNFQKKETLDQHILECHSGREYHCSQCPSVFYSPMAKSRHEKRSHAEKTVKCEQCDMMFYNNSLKNHHYKQVHDNDTNWICSHCGDGFKDKRLYKAHVNRHLNHRPHACELCGKTFLADYHLKSHMQTHTLPYQCDQCEVRVSSTGSLKDHIRVVHEGLHLECR